MSTFIGLVLSALLSQPIQALATCESAHEGIAKQDCIWLAKQGMVALGVNDFIPNGRIWIGSQGPNTFKITNENNQPATVVVWHHYDYTSSFVKTKQPIITYSLNHEESVTISMENAISGAWSFMTRNRTVFNEWGQVFNTIGEFTSGKDATVDISRLVNMNGESMTVVTQSGCLANMDKCAFKCIVGNSCWEPNTYELDAGCENFGHDSNNQPSGGCKGWNDGGHVDVIIGRG